MNKHHITPQSRIKKSCDKNAGNIAEWDKKFHKLWHMLFGNMTVNEVHFFIVELSKPNTTWDARKIQKLRKYTIGRNSHRACLCNKCTKRASFNSKKEVEEERVH